MRAEGKILRGKKNTNSGGTLSDGAGEERLLETGEGKSCEKNW